MEAEFARGEDEHQIKQLLQSCDLPYDDITPDHLPDFLVCRDAGQVVAVIGLELSGKYALLRSLAVAPAYRRQGIARRLTRQAEDQARLKGIAALYLLTTTAPNFFAGQGYEGAVRSEAPSELQQTAEFQSLCPASAVCMKKNLGPQL